MCTPQVRCPSARPHRPFHLAPRLAALGLAAGLLLPATALAGWSTQSPAPTFLDVRGVAAPGPQHFFLATADDNWDDGGALFETTDGGSTWSQRDIPASLYDPLNGIQFIDPLHGWAYGNANYRTTDGGTTWTELPFLGSTYGMAFESTSFGVASGNFGLMVTRDGGLTWDPSPSGQFAFDFRDALVGLGVSATGIHRTTDGGLTFTTVRPGDAAAVVFLSAGTAIGIVDDRFVRSTDDGLTWSTGAPAEGRRRLTAVSTTEALAWAGSWGFPAADERVFRTGNAGQAWTDLGAVIPGGVRSLVVPAPGVVVAADFAGNLGRSGDAGQTWVDAFRSPVPGPGFLSSAVPAFANAQVGIYGFGAGFVIRTTDGGITWTQVSSGSGQSLADIGRFPNGDLIAVGEGGLAVTGNGSSPWTVHPVAGVPLTAVQVLGAGSVVAVDQSGRVHRSANGGATWVPGAGVPNGLDARDVHFGSLLDGWVVGSGYADGAIFHTTDGGGTWTPVPGILGAYVSIDFRGINGWAANVGGSFRRTTDNGVTWTPHQLPGFPYAIADMEFVDAAIGYAVGSAGYAARTDDGGLTWEILPTPNAGHDFTDIALVGANELWLSTRNGVACYTATGGQNWAVLAIGSRGLGIFEAIAADPAGNAWTVGYQGYIESFAGPPPPPLNRPPVASFQFSTAGLAVNFTDTSTDPDGTVTSWSWEFGDGAISTERHPSHTYAVANTYLVRLTVTDDDGDGRSYGRAIVVQPGPGGTFGDFTEVTPATFPFVTPQDEDYWISTTSAADYDGDGDLDIAILGYHVVYFTGVEHRLVLLRNDGAAAPDTWGFGLIDVPLGDLTAGASDMAWGDADNDGDMDLAVGTDGRTVLYRNDAGVLVMTDTALPGYAEDNDQANFDLRSVTWADVDNDGDADLLIPSVFDDVEFTWRTALMRNDGPNGTGGWLFTELNAGLAPTQHAQSAWTDIDGDQDLDLLLVNLAPLTDEGFIHQYRNAGGGVFTREEILGPLTVEHGEAQWGDYDGDGDVDVLVAGNLREVDGTYDQALRIYRREAGGWTPIEVMACVPCDGWFDLTAATWADYDSDGDMDIMLTGTYNSGSEIEGRARIYLNEAGSFVDSGNDLPAPRASGSRGGTFTWLDFDGDLDLDYVIAGEYFTPGGNGLIEGQMHLYRNDMPGANDPPTAPTALLANHLGGGNVALAWTGAGDDGTPSDALTYDLELYRAGTPVATPRRLPEPGNVGAVREWRINDLPDGNYQWRLRAVDNSYSNGPAAIGNFSVGAVSATPPAPPARHAFTSGPSPFTVSTWFRFALPADADVTLDVFDVQGRLVTRLAQGPVPAGLHERTLAAGNLPNGSYFVLFRTPGFSTTRRVVLAR